MHYTYKPHREQQEGSSVDDLSKEKKSGTSFEETSGWMKEAGTGQET
jgi:hypothetical protein